jgi:hypothetical protein
MSFLDELKNIMDVESKVSPSESKRVRASPSESERVRASPSKLDQEMLYWLLKPKRGQESPNKSKRVKLRMSFMNELKNIMVVEAKASPSES